MRIAYIVPYVPNLIRTRSYNLISYLSKLGHEIDVYTIGSSQTDHEDAQALKARCANVIYYHQPLWRSLLNSVKASVSGQALQTVYSLQPQFAKHLIHLFNRREAASYDIVHIEHLRGSRYGLLIKSSCPSQPIVWDSVDCISHLFEQAAAQSKDLFGKVITRFELQRTRNAERDLLRSFDRVLVTSSTDRAALLALLPGESRSAPVSVLSNGVDQDYFCSNPQVERDLETLVFSGKMSYHANISMAKYLVHEVMPRVWKERPTVRLVIVGKDPPPAIQKLGENPLIEVTGTVHDLRPYLWRATVAVVPLLYGAGIQNKILEAMATKTPVVTMGKALAPLQAQPGTELLAAEDADEFSRAVLRLIENRELREKIGLAGQRYVQLHHHWGSIATRLSEIYTQTIAHRRSHASVEGVM